MQSRSNTLSVDEFRSSAIVEHATTVEQFVGDALFSHSFFESAESSIERFWNAFHGLPSSVQQRAEVVECRQRVNHAQAQMSKNWPSKTGNSSGKGRFNNPAAVI